ncbi:MAG: hypothetical protein ACK5KO_03790 [Arachnia sp.]
MPLRRGCGRLDVGLRCDEREPDFLAADVVFLPLDPDARALVVVREGEVPRVAMFSR